MSFEQNENDDRSSDHSDRVTIPNSSNGLLQTLIDKKIQSLEEAIGQTLRSEGQGAEPEILATVLGSTGDTLTHNSQWNEEALQLQKQLQLLVGRPPLGTQMTWFLGPGGENLNPLKELCDLTIDTHKKFRVDGIGVPFGDEGQKYSDYCENIACSDDYKLGMEVLRTRLEGMVEFLNQGSVPFQRFGYIAHMNWDNTLPGVLGWVAGVLYNQNNIAAEASPITTLMEIDVSRQLCKMIGFPNTPPVVSFGVKDEYRAEHDSSLPIPWGKITCDGSVANIESVWMARNFRFFCLALQTAMIEEPLLATVKHHEHARIHPTGRDESKLFVDLTSWEVINLIPERFFDLLDRIAKLLSPETSDDISQGHAMIHSVVEKHDLRALGLVDFVERHSVVRKMPRIFSAATRHYSWPKAVTLLGLGSQSLVSVPVGMDGRMDMSALEQELEQTVNQKIPILLAISVHGSTVEGAVDDLATLLKMREAFRQQGVDFLVHVDAAWGGYFQALMNAPDEPVLSLKSSPVGSSNSAAASETDGHRGCFGTRVEAPLTRLKPSIRDSFLALKQADSITLDPHKSGYVPYPSGGLLLKDSRLRERIAVRAPIVYKGDSDPTVSWYGLEGSRAGAAAVATWFSHQMIPLDQSGYGEILGKCLFNSTMIYAGLHYMAEQSRTPENVESAYFVTTIPDLSVNREEYQEFIDRLMTDSLQDIKAVIEPEDTDEIDRRDRRFRRFFEELGSDTAIVAYIFTPAQYIGGEFIPNPSIGLSNTLNKKLYDKYSLLEYLPDESGQNEVPELFLSSTEYSEATHGAGFMQELKARMGVEGEESVQSLVTTTMNPWFMDAPDMPKKYESSPFKRSDTVSHVLGILDHSVKKMIANIS